MTSKVKRSNNFSAEEEEKLIRLVRKHKTDIMCKKSAKNLKVIKQKAWNVIETEFNINARTFRSANVLKTKFMNMKKKSSEKFSDLSSYSKGTGGGPPKSINLTILDEEIKEISGVQITGNQSRYDDDFEEEVDNNSKDLSASYNLVDDEDEIENLILSPSQDNIEGTHNAEDNATIDDDWSEYTPEKLQKPPSAPLRCLKRAEKRHTSHEEEEPTRKRPTKDITIKSKLGSWAKTKIELAELQKDTFLQEHSTKLSNIEKKHDKSISLTEQEFSLKVKFMKEEHEKRVQLLELESQEKITLMRKEHKAKMEVINLQKENYLKKSNHVEKQ